jgi:glycosyltransferase involved in cell wall biosynthesis
MARASHPMVTVIIPTHNRSLDLKRALQSVLQQQFTDFEVLVMDDASTENLEAVIEPLNDERIQLHRNEQKTNANVMRNKGIQLARGAYVALLDSDDEWLPDHLMKKTDLMTRENVDGIYGSSFIDNGVRRFYRVSRSMHENEHPINYLLGSGFSQTSSWVLKTSAAKNIGFDETLHRHQDYDFFIRFAQAHSLYASWEPTSVIHWQKGVSRLTNFPSEQQFIQRYHDVIEKRLLCNYYFERFYSWKSANELSVATYYSNRIKENATFISFNQYRQLFSNYKAAHFPFRLLGYMILIAKAALAGKR